MAIFKNSICFIFVLLLLASAAYSASFTVKAEPIKSKIVIDEFAAYKVIIKNNLDKVDEFRIYNPDFPVWDIRTEPLLNPITIGIPSKSEGSVEIIIDPLKIRDIGTYAVNLNVRSKVTNQLVTIPLKVSVLSTDNLVGGYVPTVITSVGIEKQINPQNDIPIRIVLKNQNVIDYPDLVIKLDSNLIHETINEKLGPKEDKTFEQGFRIDPLTPPQEDNLVVALFKGNQSIINPIVRKIEIIEYSGKELVREEKKFLRTKRYYEFTSNNPEFKGTFSVETSLLDSIFSSTKPKAKVVKDFNKRYFLWNVELINNRMQVTVSENYLPFFIVIVILILIVIGYYTFRSPLVIRKESSNSVRKEGGISELTVILYLKNRGQHKIKEIDITEPVPGLVAVEREVSLGSLQPSKILRHEKKGTIVKWAIDSLDPSEERVLSYKIKSKLSILGSFSLPEAKAIFKSDNKTLKTLSNRLNIND
jgi:hypothetical protein